MSDIEKKITWADFRKKYAVTSTFEWTPTNPHMADSNRMNNYKVTLKYQGRQFTLYFSKGVGLQGGPTTKEVIECLAMDMRCIEGGLDEFVDSMGYEYREGKKVFDTIENQSAKMFKLLGFEAFQMFKKIEEE